MQMYYVAIQNQQCGPYAEDVLRQLMQTNQITPDSLVWCDLLTEWTPLNRVPELLVLWTEIKRPTPSTTSDAPRKTNGIEQAEKTDGTKKTTDESSAASDVPPTYNVTPSDETPHSTPNPPYQQPYQPYSPYQPNPYGYGPRSNSGFASFFRRFAAFLVDGIILNLLGWSLIIFVSTVAIAVTFGGDVSPGEAEELGETLSGPLTLGSILLAWLYYALSESSIWQATLGKRLMGIYVTDIYGRRLSFGRATCRWLCKIPSAMILGIGFLLALITPRCQTLHDLLVGSLVLKR